MCHDRRQNPCPCCSLQYTKFTRWAGGVEVKLLIPFPRCVSHVDLADGRCANCVWSGKHLKLGSDDCEFVAATQALKAGQPHPLAHWLQNPPAAVKFTPSVMPSIRVVKGPATRLDLMPDEAWDELAKAQRDRYELLAGQGAALMPADIGMMNIDSTEG